MNYHLELACRLATMFSHMYGIGADPKDLQKQWSVRELEERLGVEETRCAQATVAWRNSLEGQREERRLEAMRAWQSLSPKEQDDWAGRHLSLIGELCK